MRIHSTDQSHQSDANTQQDQTNRESSRERGSWLSSLLNRNTDTNPPTTTQSRNDQNVDQRGAGEDLTSTGNISPANDTNHLPLNDLYTREQLLEDFRSSLTAQSDCPLGTLSEDQIPSSAEMPALVRLLEGGHITSEIWNEAIREIEATPITHIFEWVRTLEANRELNQPRDRQQLTNTREQIFELVKQKTFNHASNLLVRAHREKRDLTREEFLSLSQQFRELGHWMVQLNGHRPHPAQHLFQVDTETLNGLRECLGDHVPAPPPRSSMDQFQDLVRDWVMNVYAKEFFFDNPSLLEGVDKIPKHGPSLMVMNHGIPVFDIPLGLRQIERTSGRPVHYLIDTALTTKAPIIGGIIAAIGTRSLYHGIQNRDPRFVLLGLLALYTFGWIGTIGTFALVSGCKEASPKNLIDGLKKNMLTALLPGGMREAMRSPDEGMMLRWEKSDGTLRDGVGRYALETNALMLPVTCSATEPMTTRLSPVLP